MKKKLIKGLIALVFVIGGAAAVTTASNDAHACTKCNTSNMNRKCKCGSSRLFAVKSWTASNGKVRTNWKCKDCPHAFTTELRNGKEVVVTGN